MSVADVDRDGNLDLITAPGFYEELAAKTTMLVDGLRNTADETGVPMTFAGSPEPCAYVEVKSIGALRPPAMTAAFCDLISARTGIAANRIYIGFEDVPASCWGWNGSTFG